MLVDECNWVTLELSANQMRISLPFKTLMLFPTLKILIGFFFFSFLTVILQCWGEKDALNILFTFIRII